VEPLTYAASGWVGPVKDRAPALADDIECDFAVIGGGFTGMAAAMRLTESGAQVVLLESEFCGWGSSSRNAGHLTPTIGGDPQILATIYRRRAPALIRLAENAVHFVEDLIEQLGIDCEYEATGNVSAALTQGQLRRSERIAKVLRRCGGEIEVVDRVGLPEGFLGGLLERTGGILNPGRLALGYRSALRSTNAKVSEGTPVQHLDADGRSVILTTPGGKVRAKRVLIASNAYTRDLSFGPDRAVAPLWVTLAETEPLDPGALEAIGWTNRSGVYTQHLILENYRPTARNTLVFGTRCVQVPKAALDDFRPNESVLKDIVKGFRQRFPSLSNVKVEKAWGGWIAMTPSWLPIAGQVHQNVFYALGYNGHGLAQAPYLGALVADQMAENTRGEDLDVLWRERSKFAPAPIFSAPAVRLGWMIDRLSDRIGDRRRNA
jgi:glycine/D-amino acid oxidase-like deaminating enzyme